MNYLQREHTWMVDLGSTGRFVPAAAPRRLAGWLRRCPRQAAREASQRSVAERRQQALIEASGGLAWYAVPGGAMLLPSPGWSGFTGQSESAIEGTGWLDAVHPDDRPALTQAWEEATRFRTPFTVEHRLRRHDGAWCWMQARGVPVLDRDGAVQEWVGVHRDITPHRQSTAELGALAAEREHVRAQLGQGQRMEAVGRLMGGLAHDFNNMLTGVLGNLELLERRIGDEPHLQRLVGGTQRAAARGVDLVEGLLAFSRVQALSTETIDLAVLLNGFVPLLRHAVGTAVQIELAMDPALPPVRADAAQLESAVLNLALNARDAIGPAGGTLVIHARQATAAEAGLTSGGRDVPCAALALTDTGPGMTPEVLARCFEPFFTTKPAGHGAGLGLCQAAGFARQNGGGATAVNQPGGGATVTLFLPLAAVPVQAAMPDPGRGDTSPGPAPDPALTTVLVVEDDPDIRELTAALLGESGYRVIAAADAADAQAVLDRAGEQVDVLFTDLMLPGGQDGIALAREARRRRPGLPILLTSGYSAGDPAGRALPPGLDLLPKPYRHHDLLARLHALAQPGQQVMQAT